MGESLHPKPGQFALIAEHYDALMAGVPYRLWSDYLEEILRRVNYHPKSILDVACGTGTVSEILYSRGYDVVGIDLSEKMIEVAIRNSVESGSCIDYFTQDATELALDRKFDLAISLFDSLNNITDESRFALAMKRVGEHIVPGGYFVFDVNTEYALAHGFFNQTNIVTFPKYVWTSDYDRQSRICTVTMVFEVMEHDGNRRQFTEIHRQKAYRLEEIDSMLNAADFETITHYHAYKFKQPTRRSDRVFFVARKK